MSKLIRKMNEIKPYVIVHCGTKAGPKVAKHLLSQQTMKKWPKSVALSMSDKLKLS